jgi:ribosomal protein S18 acetylase RimI-like enzyme
VDPSDQKRLTNLIHFEAWVHRHLDWQSAIDWIGSEPYLIAEKNGKLVAALACPAETKEPTWIRLFACSSETTPEETWSFLWPVAYQQVVRINEEPVSAIALHSWFEKLLKESGFGMVNQVVMLLWEPQDLPPARKISAGILRDMRTEDLGAIEELDHLAFSPMWQNSIDSLEIAFKQASIARVVEKSRRILAYQISTATQMGGHLARLATHPEFQGLGLGYSLLRDMLLQFESRGAQRITVNTQQDNTISLALYKKAGFTETGESYPVYQYLPK